MGRSKLTISRELSRNTGNRGYRHKQANNLACERHQQKNKHIKLTAEIKHYISKKLKEYWSPNTVAIININSIWYDASVIILAIAFAVILVLVAKVFIKRTTYRFVLQNKAVGGFSADLNFLIQL
jgi:IS30 family transposase